MATADIRERLSALPVAQQVDPSAQHALQQLTFEEATRILDEVESKSDLRNMSAFIVSKVQKTRLRTLLDDWGDHLDREARQLLRSVPTRRAVEVLELAEAQRSTIRNPSAFICSAVKDKTKWPPQPASWPENWPGGPVPYDAAWTQAAYGAYGAFAGAYAAALATYGGTAPAWPGALYGWSPSPWPNAGLGLPPPHLGAGLPPAWLASASPPAPFAPLPMQHNI